MANKKLFYVIMWYITWTIVASLYSNKKWDEIRQEMDAEKEKGNYEDKKVLLDHILAIHKKLFQEVSQDQRVQKTTALFNEYKDEAKKAFDSSKEEITNIIKENKNLWEKEVQELSQKLQGFLKSKLEFGTQVLKETLSKVKAEGEKVEAVVEEKVKTAVKKSAPVKKTTSPRTPRTKKVTSPKTSK